MIQPDFNRFQELATHRRVISVYEKVIADEATPVSLYQRLAKNQANTFLLESVSDGHFARYSFIGLNAAGVLDGVKEKSHWQGQSLADIDLNAPPLTVIKNILSALDTEADTALPPLTSGLVGYLGYDIVRYLEDLPDNNVDDLKIPDLKLILATDLAIFDHLTGELWLIANAINFDNSGARLEQAYLDAQNRIKNMLELLAQPMLPITKSLPENIDESYIRQRDKKSYSEVVTQAISEIKAGEAFQIVLSQRFEMPCLAEALDVYRVLRRSNPSPYLYLFNFADFAVVGSSPEALVTVKDGIATTHPIAGTRSRGKTIAEDQALATELLTDEKERAEHLMLVDLGRNDLGKIAEPGTVRVEEFFQIRRYSHVMHLEASVSARLAEDQDALSTTLACFPAGTLSGAPKVSAMKIIDNLELSRRGLYGGIVGYFDFAGNSDFAIAIRTGLLKNKKAYVQAGAGIVADSVPANEDLECQNKAKAVLQAVATANAMSAITK